MKIKEIKLGDTYYLKIYILDKDGNPKDLSAITNVLYRMAKSVKSNDYFIDKDLSSNDVSIEDAANGLVVIRLPQGDTKNLQAGTAFHEAQLEANNGDIVTVVFEDLKLIDQLIAGS